MLFLVIAGSSVPILSVTVLVLVSATATATATATVLCEYSTVSSGIAYRIHANGEPASIVLMTYPVHSVVGLTILPSPGLQSLIASQSLSSTPTSQPRDKRTGGVPSEAIDQTLEPNQNSSQYHAGPFDDGFSLRIYNDFIFCWESFPPVAQCLHLSRACIHILKWRLTSSAISSHVAKLVTIPVDPSSTRCASSRGFSGPISSLGVCCLPLASRFSRWLSAAPSRRWLAWTCDAIDFFSVSLSVTRLQKQFNKDKASTIVRYPLLPLPFLCSPHK